MRLSKWLVACFGTTLLFGCGILPERTAVNDPSLVPLWRAAAEFDRTTYGFSPLPTEGVVFWETSRWGFARRGSYDEMLHLYEKTSRTIAFTKTADGYLWVGEQESFEGPNVYQTPDGEQHESITLTYETTAVSGAHLNVLNIIYNGEDRRLAWPKALTLADVSPILAEWGYRSRPN